MEYSKKFFFTIAILLPAMIAGAQEKNKMTHEMTEFYSPEVPNSKITGTIGSCIRTTATTLPVN